MVPIGKFEQLCKELENSLKREQLAERLLTQQSAQFEELTLKLSHTSNSEIEELKLKEVPLIKSLYYDQKILKLINFIFSF